MAACLCTAVLGAAALLWSGVVTHGAADVITGGGIAAAAAAGAIVMRRAHPDPILCVTLCVIAVMFVAVAGFLAVPGGPSTPNSLLAAAAACSTSILLFRITGCGAICLTALATLSRVDECGFGLRCRVDVARIHNRCGAFRAGLGRTRRGCEIVHRIGWFGARHAGFGPWRRR